MASYYLKITPANVPFDDDVKRADYLARCCKFVINRCQTEQPFGVFKYLFSNDSGLPFGFAIVLFKPRLKGEFSDSTCDTDSEARREALAYLTKPETQSDLIINARYFDLEGMIHNSDLF